MDKAEPLSMTDMMGDMSAMDHGRWTCRTCSSLLHKINMITVPIKIHYPFPRKQFATPARNTALTVDARVNTPRTNLDDPGIGLRNNGRRVLTLADLHSLESTRPCYSSTRD